MFEYEVDAIFMKEWLRVGRVEEFEIEGGCTALVNAAEQEPESWGHSRIGHD